jgi:hypothetical protein
MVGFLTPVAILMMDFEATEGKVGKGHNGTPTLERKLQTSCPHSY